jgi:predicted DNA-binding protein (UPF0251 family)
VSAAYNREMVERLLPAVWDEDFAWGMRDPYAPDVDMPKRVVGKKKDSPLFAMLADIKTAWRAADLTRDERAAVFLHAVYDDTQQDIAALLGCHQSTAKRRIERGIGKLTAHLNGEPYIDGYNALVDHEDVA